jgi:uncharacterized protein YjdB
VYCMKTLKQRTFGSWALRAFSPCGLAAIIIAGLVFTGCEDPKDDTKPDPNKPVPVTGVTVVPSTLKLVVGQTGTVVAQVSPSTATNKTVTWSSSNDSVVSVDRRSGVYRGEGKGTASIIVKTTDGERVASCEVTVETVAVTSVALNKKTLELFIPAYEALTVTVFPAEATNKTVNWGTSDSSKATVNGSGRVTAVAEGVVTITVTSADDPTKTDTCTVTVKKVPVTSVTLFPKTLTLSVGGNPGLSSPTVLPANATFKTVSWESSNTSAATVTADGRIIPVAVGETTITVKSTDDPTKTDTCVVNVVAAKKKIDGMVWIEPGSFMMGARDDELAYPTERPRHQVTLTAGFYMGEIGVSQDLYREVMGEENNPSFFDLWDREVFTNPAILQYAPYWPVDSVTWYDAVEFCNKLSTKKGLTPVYTIEDRTPATGYPITNATVTATWTNNGYRLPTEAQWEYACRAGTTTDYNIARLNGANIIGYGSNNITVDDANFDDDSDDAWWQTNPGGTDPSNPQWPWLAYPPNAWGLYDMHGNLEEWCWDWFANYTAAAATDPRTDTQSSQGNFRVTRGGSWYDEDPGDIRSASRNGWGPGSLLVNSYYPQGRGFPWLGFRVVLPESAASAFTSQIRPSLQGGRQIALSSIKSAVTLTANRLGVTSKDSSIRPSALKVRRERIEGVDGEY